MLHGAFFRVVLKYILFFQNTYSKHTYFSLNGHKYLQYDSQYLHISGLRFRLLSSPAETLVTWKIAADQLPGAAPDQKPEITPDCLCISPYLILIIGPITDHSKVALRGRLILAC